MKATHIRSFSSRDAANAFIEGILFANDTALKVLGIDQKGPGCFLVRIHDKDA
jgi:hypothetical protein